MNVLPLCLRRFCECLFFALLLLLPIQFSTHSVGEIPVAYASVAPESRGFTSLWSDVMKQIKGVMHFGAQAIGAVLEVPQNGFTTVSPQNTLSTDVDALPATLATEGMPASVSIARASKTGSLLVNVPFTVANNLLVEADTSLAATTVRDVLTVRGQALIDGLTVGGVATADMLRVRVGGSFGSLAVVGKTTLSDIVVSGDAVVEGLFAARGGVKTEGATIDTQGGKVFASNIINSITAGKNITITGTANDLIISAKSSGGGGSSAGVTSVNGSTGAVVLVGGTDITIAGLVVTNNSTLDSVRLRGGCVGCITDTDVLDALTISGGVIENTVIGSTTPASARFTELTVTTSATSTFAGGVNLQSGCFAILGTCIGATVAVDELIDLLDVSTASTTAGDVFVFNGTDWTNRATATLGLGNGSFLGLSDTPNSFLAGALSFVNASGSALTQSANLVFDGTSLAIGATSALERLTVNGSAGVLGQGAMRFYDGNSSNYVALRATSSLLSNVTWTLPPSDGSANQILVTNGVGQLSFASIGALGTGPSTFLELTDTVDSYINKAIPYVATSTLSFSSNFVFDGSRVGIGTNAPTSTLTVVGSVRFGSSVATPGFVYNSTSDNVGIGSIYPSERLTLEKGSFLQRGGTASNTYRPVQTSSLNLPDSVNDLQVVGDTAYVVNGSGGNEFHIINISDADTPVESGSLNLPTSANAVAVSGIYAFVVTDISASEFQIINVADPANPFVVSTVNLPSTAFDVFVQGRYAYVVTDGAGNDLHVIDIGNPATAYVVNSLNLSGGGNAIVVNGKYAYIASDSLTEEFKIVNISNPNSLTSVGSVNLSAAANDLFIDGRYVYVVTSSTGNDFHTIDIANPAAPVEVGALELNSTSYALAVTGNYAYVSTADVSDDFHVIDVSAPTAPVKVGSESLSSGSGLAVSISGKYAYVGTSAIGDDFHVIDISGIEVQSAFVHSLESGNLFTQGDITIGGGASLVGGLRSGIAGIQTDGSLFIQGTSSSFFRGTLGIGTTTPSEELTVAGDLRLTGRLYDSVNSAGVNGAILRSLGTGQSWVATSTLGLSSAFANSAQLGALLSDETGSGSVVFSNNPTFTGTVTASGVSLSAALVLTGTSANISLGSNYLSGDGGDEGVFVTAGGLVGIGTSTPTEELTVTGTIQATNLLGGATSLSTDAQGNIIRTPSDERLKTDITTIEGALLKVLSLRGVTYSWQDTERFGDQKEIGFLAQEVELILPEAVRKGGEYWSLNTSNIVAVVVEAVKELWSTLENQQEKIDALEARVQYLESHSGGTQQPGDVGYTEVEIKEIAPEGATEEQNNPEESATDPVTLEPASLPIETNEEQVPVSVEISN